MKLFQNNKKALTLIELLVVIAIIGILAAISLKVYSKSYIESKELLAKIRLYHNSRLEAVMSDDMNPQVVEAMIRGRTKSSWK